MENGYYDRLTFKSVPELENDNTLQNLINQVWNFYDNYLCNKDGSSIDDDTSSAIFFCGDFHENVFYSSKIIIEFEFLDEFNDVISQNIIADLDNGMVYIQDDDEGLIFKQYVDEFKIYED